MSDIHISPGEALYRQYADLPANEQQWFWHLLALDGIPPSVALIGLLIEKEGRDLAEDLEKSGVILDPRFKHSGPRYPDCDAKIIDLRDDGASWKTIQTKISRLFPDSGGRDRRKKPISLPAIRKRYYRALER